MNLFSMLSARAEANDPVRVGLIGAGKFGSMFLAQLNRLPGIHLVGICDLSPERARSNLALVGWPSERFSATSLDDAAAKGTTHVGVDWRALVASQLLKKANTSSMSPSKRMHFVDMAWRRLREPKM